MSTEQPTDRTSDGIQPLIDKTHPIGYGTQRLYRFDNGFGASVVRFHNGLTHNYGGEHGLWELAVVTFFGPGHNDFELVYDTPITEDVLGWLDDEKVEETLRQIRDLPTQAGDPS